MRISNINEISPVIAVEASNGHSDQSVESDKNLTDNTQSTSGNRQKTSDKSSTDSDQTVCKETDNEMSSKDFAIEKLRGSENYGD